MVPRPFLLTLKNRVMEVLMRKTVADSNKQYVAGRRYQSSDFGPGKLKYYMDKGWATTEIQEPKKPEPAPQQRAKDAPKKSTDYKAKEAIEMMADMSEDERVEFTIGEQRATVLKAV